MIHASQPGVLPEATARRRAAPVHDTSAPLGGFTLLDGETYYRISAFHHMPPFLMSIASDSDLWMFLSSAGGLTAGRVDPDGSLFPYETVDKLHHSHHHTGPITLLRVQRKGSRPSLWRPFTAGAAEAFHIERNLYKNTHGNRVIFEEINHDLALAFRYRWSGSDPLGLVRTATLANLGAESTRVSFLDGLRNVLPYGVPLRLYQQSSSLVDAYKRTDCEPDTGLGIFSLTTTILDRPDAAEELRANTIWCQGLAEFDVCLSSDAVAAFRRGDRPRAERTLTGRRGNYLLCSSLELEPGADAKWHLVADVGRSHLQVAALLARLREDVELDNEIEAGLLAASDNLLRNVSSADGVQVTAQARADVHHFANVLFNNMRGGVYAQDYGIPKTDLADFLSTRNWIVAGRHQILLQTLPAEITLNDLLASVARSGDANLERLTYEYLPLYFGRRHGDPSRPWNRFAIRIKNPDGSRALRYEGNWRDIFQNWEALSLSFPGFLPSIIAKFVNASTVDGFNPYRLTRDGIDWEVIDPDDPWSHIGYWGDHQIIYLLRLLEALRRFSPGALKRLLDREIFSYSEVPYRLKPYAQMLGDPHATIIYDSGLASKIEDRVDVIGTDGKLLTDSKGSVYHVNLLEKLLVPALSKLSNLVPDGGIWMNTQRPEWNDANNALVGHGVSVVTLCYLRRYLRFLEELLEDLEARTPSVSTEVATWCRQLASILDERRPLLESSTLDDSERKRLLDGVGSAFSDYREAVYAAGFSGKRDLPVVEITQFCRLALEYLDHAIGANRRPDGLYHAYNLFQMTSDGDAIAVRPLFEMLEGQVAALSSGLVGAREATRLLSSLFESRLYREDQRSFLLYPDRELPAFIDKNVVPDASVRAVPLLRELLDRGESSVVARDALGICRFHPDFRNARDVASALDRLAAQEPWFECVSRDHEAVLEVFEDVFNHRSFTGRSGRMYGYEGLGCVYWHMVSKLLLAVQEIALRAARQDESAPILGNLAKAYYRIRAGLGFEKPVTEYGAFPTDPYSHTPAHGGAQQPGMTGQVKEEVLTRFGELGVQVEAGRVRFWPILLRRSEFRKEIGTYRFYDLDGHCRSIEVPAGALAFSFCQVPVIYTLGAEEATIRVTAADGASSRLAGDCLDAAHSQALFERRSSIARLDVGVPEGVLCRVDLPQ